MGFLLFGAMAAGAFVWTGRLAARMPEGILFIRIGLGLALGSWFVEATVVYFSDDPPWALLGATAGVGIVVGLAIALYGAIVRRRAIAGEDHAERTTS